MKNRLFLCFAASLVLSACVLNTRLPALATVTPCIDCTSEIVTSMKTATPILTRSPISSTFRPGAQESLDPELLTATAINRDRQMTIEAIALTPTMEKLLPPSPNQIFGEDITYVTITGGLLAVGDAGGNLTFLDLTDPSQPRPLSNISLGTEQIDSVDVYAPVEIRNVKVQGTKAYVLTISQLFIFDISDPTRPVELTMVILPAKLNDMQIRGSELWIVIADVENNKILLMELDVSDPSNIQRLGETQLPEISAGRVRMNGDIAYITVRDVNSADDLKFYAIQDPSHISKSARVYGLPAFRAWVSGSTAYIATGRMVRGEDKDYYTEVASVAIVDISNRDDPSSLGYIWTPELATDLVTSAGRAFIVGNQPHQDLGFPQKLWFNVVDIQDPRRPQILRSTHLLGQADMMALFRRYAYIAAGENGLYVVEAEAASLVRTLQASDLRIPQRLP